MVSQAVSIPRSLGALFDIGVVGDLSDAQLLERFTTGHRESAELAFHALVERHGPMVLRVCRRLLSDPNDAEDAFQATFLVLLRRAGAIRERGSVASWLHGVALRVASRARIESSRRRRIERQSARTCIVTNDRPDRLDLDTLIDEELTRLPEKYRAPIVLCYLEGLTHEVAAARLGWPVGTVRGRLSRAKDLLRSRLTRRGVTASVALAAIEGLVDPANAAVPAALRDATAHAAVQTAAGSAVATAASAQIAAWVAGVSRGFLIERVKLVACTGLLIGTFGAGFAMLGAPAQPPTERAAPVDAREAVRREMLQLQGTWATFETVEENLNGVLQPPKKVKVIWSIHRDSIVQSDRKGFAGWSFRYTLDPDKSPKWIDLTSDNTPLVLHGIYKLEGDTLTIRYDHERPARFEVEFPETQFVFRRESREPTTLAPEFPTAEGCYWADEPGGVPGSSAGGNLNMIVTKERDGAMQVVLATLRKVTNGEPDVEYRPVAFDGSKKRHLFTPGQGGWSTSAAFRGVALAQQTYRLDPAALPYDRVTDLGIEVIPAEVRRADEIKASAAAIQEAREAGIEILPRPEVGKPFGFSLTDSTGRAIRSSDLKGKVVLIDCWAAWSGPTLRNLSRIKGLYDRRRDEGFEVIGLNFDADRGRAEPAAKAMGLAWPQVFVPGDARTRRLWKAGPGFPQFPRNLLMDREGILRWDGQPEELEARIESLLR